MLKTGNIFIDFFSQVVIFFPLLPVIIIFLRRIYQKEVLNYLMILCLLNFSRDLAVQTLQIKYINQGSIRNIFSLLEFVIVIQIFKSILKEKSKEIVNIFTIAILSAIITYYLVKGSDQKKILLDVFQNSFIIMLTAYSLVMIVQYENLRIFYSALFWIATGTLFYFVIAMLLDIIDDCCPQLQHPITTDKMLLLNIASLVRYFFYTLATLLYSKP
jgi:hypothetical protein